MLMKWLVLLGSILLIGAFFWMLSDTKVEDGPLIYYGLRGGIVFFSLAGWFASQSLVGARSVRAGFIGDAGHELTAPLHFFLATHPRAANMLLMVSSAVIDILGLLVIFASVFGPNMKPLGALIILFLMRQVCQGFCALPVPPGMIWRNPGFPSLLVTYKVGNDFFFSGHTALAVLAAIVVAQFVAVQILPLWVAAIVSVVAAGEALVVIILRAHYTLDVFTAVLAAFCAAALADWITALFASLA
jgi:hypothetical protein